MAPPHPHLGSPVLVGDEHAEEDEQHEEALHCEHGPPQQPVLLDPAGRAVVTARAARPAGQADGHGGVTGPGPVGTATARD